MGFGYCPTAPKDWADICHAGNQYSPGHDKAGKRAKLLLLMFLPVDAPFDADVPSPCCISLCLHSCSPISEQVCEETLPNSAPLARYHAHGGLATSLNSDWN